MRDCGLAGLTFTQPSLVKPQFAADCDLHNIIDRFMRTGQLPPSHARSSIADATTLPDNFQDVMDSAVKVRQQFDMLPVDEREKFGNDPDAWLAAVQAQQKETPDDSVPSEDTSKETSKETPKE